MKGSVLGAALLALAACHGSASPTSTPGDDAAASTCPCTVALDGGGAVQIACGQIGCAGGDSYLCQSSGQADYQGPCVVLDDGGGVVVEACAPQCPPGQCGTADQCGGVCGCSNGEQCIGGVCGNGCSLGAGSYCTPGGTPCCATGNACQPNEAGASECCATTDGGVCVTDTDCCDYPSVHCNPVTTDAGAVYSRACN